MRYRSLDLLDDYSIGIAILVDSPAAVAQAVKTRIRLFAGEWFLDSNEGLSLKRIVGERTKSTRDQEIQQRILGTPGVRSLLNYSSTVDTAHRTFTVTATIDTIYGSAPLSITEAL